MLTSEVPFEVLIIIHQRTNLFMEAFYNCQAMSKIRLECGKLCIFIGNKN